jgi:hypothetical protein
MATHPAPASTVMLTARRVQAGSPELFSGAGIDPMTRRIIVVKSMQHFYAGFAPISARVIYAGDKGALASDVRSIPYRAREDVRLLAVQRLTEFRRLMRRALATRRAVRRDRRDVVGQPRIRERIIRQRRRRRADELRTGAKSASRSRI